MFETVDIDGDTAVRPQHHLAAVQHQAVVPAECLPGVVCGLAQVGRAGIGLELRPQGVDDAVACHAPLRRQAQQLHQLGRAQAGPALGGYLSAVARHREAAQQADPEVTGGLEFFDGVENDHVRPSVRVLARQRNAHGDRERFRNTPWRCCG